MPLTYVESVTSHQQGVSQGMSLRRSLTVSAVVLLHMAMFYAFTHGMNVVKVLLPPSVIKLVALPPEIKPPDPVPQPKLPTPVEFAAPVMTPDVPVVDMFMPVPDTQPSDTDLSVAVETMPTSGAGPVVQNVDAPLQVLHRETPAYPATARRAGIEGSVVLAVMIAPDGSVTSATVVRSSGSMDLDDAALQAIQRWRFTGHTAGTVQVTVPISFRLQRVRF